MDRSKIKFGLIYFLIGLIIIVNLLQLSGYFGGVSIIWVNSENIAEVYGEQTIYYPILTIVCLFISLYQLMKMRRKINASKVQH